MRSRIRAWIAVPAVVAALGLAAGTVHAAQSNAPGNPDQAYGPGIMSVQVTNMCMWDSEKYGNCFKNDPDDGGSWEDRERATAQAKREALIDQAERNQADVITVNEGCQADLEAVAEEIGYDLVTVDTAAGEDGIPRQCSVGRGDGVNGILAKNITGDGPTGYFRDKGHRSYVCAQVSTREWDSVRVCTAHLSTGEQQDGELREQECQKLNEEILAPSQGSVVFAGDVNMKGANQNCAPDNFDGLKDLNRDGNNKGTPGLDHIYYTQDMKRQSCGWAYNVEETDHKGFLLELGESEPELGSCWRDVRE